MNATRKPTKFVLVSLGLGAVLAGATALAMTDDDGRHGLVDDATETPARAMPISQAAARRASVRPAPHALAAPRGSGRMPERLLRAEGESSMAATEPLAFPTDLEPRFASIALEQAFAAAMSEVAIEGAVLDIDCSEYPCIVYAQGSDRDDVETLLNAPAMNPYMRDGMTSTTRVVRDPKDPTKQAVFFSVSFRRAGDELDPSQRARLQHREKTGLRTLNAPAGR